MCRSVWQTPPNEGQSENRRMGGVEIGVWVLTVDDLDEMARRVENVKIIRGIGDEL